MTAHPAVTQVVMTAPLQTTVTKPQLLHVHNLHRKATCSSEPEQQRVLVWGCTFCECSPSWPPCSPCPCLACSPGNVCIPNVPLVWSFLLIYGAAIGTVYPICYAVIHKPSVMFQEDGNSYKSSAALRTEQCSAIPHLLPYFIP